MNINSVSPTNQANLSTATASQFSPDSFLKLLIAELRNQDPNNPMDSQAMIAQLATMDQVSETRATRQGQDMLQAVGLIGKTVVWQDEQTGIQQSDLVTGVVRNGSDPEIVVGSQQLKLSQIVAIT